MGRRIVNGRDMGSTGEGNGDRVINHTGGTYTEHHSGGYVQGDVIDISSNVVSWDTSEPQSQRQDYSGDAVDVNAEEVKDEPKKGWFW